MKFNFKDIKIKVRKWWNEHKEDITDVVKFTIMNVMMSFGFFLTLAMIWTSFNWPTDDWAMWLLFILAVGVERLFLEWLAN